MTRFVRRFFAVCAAALLVTGCENIDDLSRKPTPIGEFALGHNVVVAPNFVVGPASRTIEDERWIEAMKTAIDDRFGRYEGEQLYHFGISLEGYVLAQPGLPVVLAPKSVLILNLTVWDDAAGAKLNAEPEQITVLENLDGDTIVGSGLTKTAEEQMATLTQNAAKVIQRWITRRHYEEQWFKKRANSTPQVSASTTGSAAAPDAQGAQSAQTTKPPKAAAQAIAKQADPAVN